MADLRMKKLTVGCLRAALVLTLLLAGSPARADTGLDKARGLFREGTALYKRGMYLDALKKFRQARAVYPSVKIDLNIGATLRALDRLPEAAAYYDKFLLQSRDASPEVVGQVRKLLTELRAKLASVKIVCPVPGATVVMDDRAVGQTPLDQRQYLLPGRHRVTVRKGDTLAFTQELALRAGEHVEVTTRQTGGQDKQRARVLFLDANQLFQKGLYLDALKKYRRARALYPSYKIEVNIGTTLDAMGRRGEAAQYFERFLLAARDASPEIRDAAKNRLRWLRKNLARVTVSSVVPGVVVTVDAKQVGTTPVDLPLYIEPGVHELGATKPLYVAITRQLKLKAGQQTNLPLPMQLASEQREYKERVRRQALRRSKGIWAYATLGAGLAVATAAGVLYGVGISQGDAAHERYMNAKRPEGRADASRDINEAERMVISAHVLAGLTVATLGVSVYQFITRPSAEAARLSPGRPGKAPGARTSLGVVPLQGGGLLSLGGRF